MQTDDDSTRRIVERLGGNAFAFKRWASSAALLPLSGSGESAKFHGQSFDLARYKLVRDGWNRDHCPFCSIAICGQAGAGSVAQAYTDGDNWVCADCFERHLRRG